MAAVAHQLEQKVQVMHSQLVQLPQLQHELKQLQEQQRQLDNDHAVQMQVRTLTDTAFGSMSRDLEGVFHSQQCWVSTVAALMHLYGFAWSAWHCSPDVHAAVSAAPAGAAHPRVRASGRACSSRSS